MPEERFLRDKSYNWDRLIRDLIDLQEDVNKQQEKIVELEQRIEDLENP